ALRKARHRDAQAVLIFEDDLIFHPEFEERFKQIHLPKDWGILYLGCLHIECPKPVAPGLVKVERAFSTHALAIRAPYFAEVQRPLKRGRPKEGILTNKDSLAVDTLRAELHTSMPTYAIWPDLVWQQPKPEGNRWVTA